MKRTIYLLLGFIIALCFTACENEESRPDPTISFLTGEGYTYTDISAKSGDTVLIGINAESNGTDMLSNIVVTVNEVELVNESINQHEYTENFNHDS